MLERHAALVLALLVAAPAPALAADAPQPATATPFPPLAPARRVTGERFATSPNCWACHSNSPDAGAMRDAAGAAVAPVDLWRSSMMANAARDPLFRAALSAEVAATPSRAAAIEAKCLSCHAPMASTEARLAGEPPIGRALLSGDDDRAQLALDGVSCTLCHQIGPERLGTRESFSAGFTIGVGKRIFGPHPSPFETPMVRRTGFTPAEGAHVMRAALCATCHTLETEAFRADGSAVPGPGGGPVRFPEQTPYLEWRASAFNDEVEPARRAPEAASCQACHLPRADARGATITARIARAPSGRDFANVKEREPYGRHAFVGGNTLVPAMLRDHADVLQPNAPAAGFDATIAAARVQLRERTARLAIRPGERDGAPARERGRLRFRVAIENLAGHKLPSGHPTRRAFLRVRVRDASGAVLFASGEVDARGRLLGPDGSALPGEAAGGPWAPHVARVERPDEVPIFEAVLGDEAGGATFTLLRAVRWLKDNRLLPKGFRAEDPDAAAVRPVGVAGDTDFTAGGDAVLYDLPVAAAGSLTVEADLLYQVLSPRFAAELLRWDTPEMAAFRGFYEAADVAPERVAGASRVMDP